MPRVDLAVVADVADDTRDEVAAESRAGAKKQLLHGGIVAAERSVDVDRTYAEFLGAELRTFASRDRIGLTLNVPKRTVDSAFALLADLALRPQFRASEVARQRDLSELASMLRRLNKPVTLAVNKIDTPKNASLVHEVHELGIADVIPVSAEHKVGVYELLDFITRSPASRDRT